MTPHFSEFIQNCTNASGIAKITRIQELWSGYGEIVRVYLIDGDVESIIAKNIELISGDNHPRGWNTNTSHSRKVKSYQVEQVWYENYSDRCDEWCRIPQYIESTQEGNNHLILLEDLDASGFPIRKSELSKEELMVCVDWLANFHVTFLGVEPLGLWEQGTYWHLDTRPDEYERMEDGVIKEMAVQMDDRLKNCSYQTLVHGDAKVANFCFSDDAENVAAVDFQYIGQGCGMKDLTYLMGSCLTESECMVWEEEILERYFRTFSGAAKRMGLNIDAVAVEKEWRSLYSVAWTDFTRFLLGWMPGHQKLNRYSKMLAERTMLIFE